MANSKKSRKADEEEEVTEEVVQESSILHDRAVLMISGELTGDHLGVCHELLNFHYRDNFNDHITLLINSPGGSTDVGWAIVDVMNFIRLPVHTVCIGLAASMAADIFINGDQRTMGEHSTLMIHPHSSFSGGSYHKLIANLKGDVIENNRRIHHYVTNSKYSTIEEVEKNLFSTRGEDLWLTPQECLDHGLCDAIAINSKERKRPKAPAVGAELIRTTSGTVSGTKPKPKSKR